MKLAVPDLISNSYFPALAAIELNCFAAEGLEVELEVLFPPDRAYAVMRDGAVQLVAASAHTALAAFPGWAGVRLVCAQSRGMYWFLVLHRDLGAQRGEPAALKGRRIGAAPWVELGLRRMLTAAGLDPVRDSIIIAPVPHAPGTGPNFGLSAARALAERKIDGFWANGMAAARAVRDGVGTVILDVRRGDGPPGCFGYTMATIAATEAALRQTPELAGQVRRAIARTHALLRADPALAARVGRRWFPPEAAAMIGALIERDLPFYDPAITPDDIAALNRFAMDMGLMSEDVPFNEVVAA